MYKVGEGVEFHYTFKGEDTWVAAKVTKAERKANSETDNEKVPHYELELIKRKYCIMDALDNNIRTPSPYQVNEEVQFLDKDSRRWVPALVTEVGYKAVSAQDRRQVPYYILKLKKNDGVRALADELRAPQLYTNGDKVEFYDEDAGEGTWVAAVVINHAEYKTINDTKHHQVYDLRLGLNLKGGALVKKGVPATSIRPLHGVEEHVDLQSENGAISETGTDISPTSEKGVPTTSIRPLHEVEEKVDLQSENGALSETGVDIDPPTSEYDERHELSTPTANEKPGETSLEKKSKQKTAQPQSQKPSAALDFGEPNASPTKTNEAPTPENEDVDAKENSGDKSAPTDDNPGETFVIGDRVEVFRNNRFKSAEITGATVYVSNTVYSVRYDDQSTENNVKDSNMQRLFEKIGTRVHLRTSADKGTWNWGIVRGREKPRRDIATTDIATAVGRDRYTVLTRLDAPLEVKRCEVRDMKFFSHVFNNYETVEVRSTDEGTGAVLWQLATVQEADQQAATYSVRVGSELVTVPGKQLRPSFIVGNFVRVLNHTITNTRFSGVSSWVRGVVMSIDAVSGGAAHYNILLHEESQDPLPDILTVDMPDLLENWPQEFSQHEHVEVRVDADKIYSTGQHAMRCTNGIVLHTDPDKNVYEVLDLDAESSQASMLKVHSQVLRKRFLYGEKVECYLQQTGLPQGWFPAYVMHQFPNAVASPTRTRRKERLRRPMHSSTSMYEVLLRGMKGGVREQKVRVPSYCIRKLLGCPLLERIFPELLESARVQRTDEQVSERLRTFRATICENDKVEVTMVTGKPFQQQSMRHAVCTRPPGKFNPTVDVRYLDESVELGLQSTRVFPGQAIDLSRHEMHVHTLQHLADPDGITNRDDIAEETDEDDIYISEKADEDDISEKADEEDISEKADEDDISEKADEDEVSDKADMEAGAETATKINRELFVGDGSSPGRAVPQVSGGADNDSHNNDDDQAPPGLKASDIATTRNDDHISLDIPQPEPKHIPQPEPKHIPQPEPEHIPQPEPKHIPQPEPKVPATSDRAAVTEGSRSVYTGTRSVGRRPRKRPQSAHGNVGRRLMQRPKSAHAFGRRQRYNVSAAEAQSGHVKVIRRLRGSTITCVRHRSSDEPIRPRRGQPRRRNKIVPRGNAAARNPAFDGITSNKKFTESKAEIRRTVVGSTLAMTPQANATSTPSRQLNTNKLWVAKWLAMGIKLDPAQIEHLLDDTNPNVHNLHSVIDQLSPLQNNNSHVLQAAITTMIQNSIDETHTE